MIMKIIANELEEFLFDLLEEEYTIRKSFLQVFAKARNCDVIEQKEHIYRE